MIIWETPGVGVGGVQRGILVKKGEGDVCMVC